VAKAFWEQTWDKLSDKKEKKMLLKALVYLDTLITLYRMPPAFEFAITELSQRFRGIKEEALELVLQKFCTISLQDKGENMRRPKNSGPSKSQFKVQRSKEQGKTLMLHIIGLMVHLSTTHSAKLSFLSRILKREASELKNYCVELGLRLEACKSKDRETGKEFDD
jgi:hypothetical protein